MKTFVLIFIALIFQSNYSSASVLDCYPEDEPGCTFATYIDSLLIPGHDSCMITFTYKYKVCNNTHYLYIEPNWSFKLDSSGCDGLGNYIFVDWPGYSMFNPTNINNVYKELYKQMAQRLFLQQTALDKDAYLCPNYNYTLQFKMPNCKLICATFTYTDPMVELNPTNFIYQEATCNISSCCTYQLGYCYIRTGTPPNYVYTPNYYRNITGPPVPTCSEAPLPFIQCSSHSAPVNGFECMGGCD